MRPRPDSLHVIVGPMFSGKTGALLDALESAERDGARVIAVKPAIENRYPSSEFASHDGRRRDALAVWSPAELEAAVADCDLAGIDEIQFFERPLADVIAGAATGGRRVVAAGLDLDFRGKPFVVPAVLVSGANTVARLTGICGLCGALATHTQRLTQGHAAPDSDPTVVVGGAELYQPRCRSCFEAERA